MLTAGCNIPGPSLAGIEGLQVKVTRYYADHATEENGICRAPEIAVLPKTKIVEDTDTQIVVRFALQLSRYRFR